MIKRITAFFLAAILIFSTVAPIVSANETEEICDIPTVTIEGMGHSLYKADGEKVYPLPTDEVTAVLNNMFDFHKEYPRALLTDDWTAYADAMVNIFAEIYKDFYLDPDGNTRDGTGIRWDMYNDAPEKHGNFTTEDYVFEWDWRVDPFVTCEVLEEYISLVCERTGFEKVNLIGRCLGSTVAAAYLKKYGTEKIESCIFYVPTIGGSLICEKLYTGQIVLDTDTIDRFAQEYLAENDVLPDATLQPLVASIITLLNYTNTLDLAVNEVQRIYTKIVDMVLPRVVRMSYGSFPTFWAMIGNEEDYVAAKKFIFGGVEDEYAGLIEKIDNFHYNVYQPLYSDLKTYKSEGGVDFAVIAKYGPSMLPIFEDSDILSDGLIALESLSFGATCSAQSGRLSDEYIASHDSKYISPDKKVDASTCLFPDQTWIIKNLEHANFPDCVDDLMLTFFRSGGKMTVDSNPAYPQFTYFNSENETLISYAEGDKGDFKYTSSFLEALMKFIRSLAQYIKSLVESKMGDAEK